MLCWIGEFNDILHPELAGVGHVNGCSQDITGYHDPAEAPAIACPVVGRVAKEPARAHADSSVAIVVEKPAVGGPKWTRTTKKFPESI